MGIVSRKDQLANFTSSLNSLYQDEVKLIRYMRQMKLATGGDVQRRLIRRSAETTTTKSEEEETTTESEDATTTAKPESETDWSMQRDEEDDEEENEETTTVSSSEETTANWRKRGFKRKRIKRPRSSKEETTGRPVTTEAATDVPSFLDD